MTRTRFAIAAMLQSFGVLRKTKRLTDAAFELHLMQDGEEILGSCCWREIEDIEDLSMEYWNLRRMDREEKELIRKLHEAEETLNSAQSNRAEIINRTKDVGQELYQEREDLFEKIEDLGILRDEIMTEAAGVKRKYRALKLKFEVLVEEEKPDKENLQKCLDQLNVLKKEFIESKSKIVETETKIDEKEDKLGDLQDQIDSKLQGSKGESTESFSLISKANRDITTYRAELGLLNDEQAKAFREVGRFLNLNAKREDCRRATKGYRGLVEQTRLLYQSVQLNRRLVERVS